MTAHYVTCRYLDRHGNQCTGEVADPAGEILLCTGHLARALQLLCRHAAGTLPAGLPSATSVR